MLRPAVFLDRDGTLIEDRGYLSDPAEVAFFVETIDALRSLQTRYLLFIVTNQSGIGEGVVRAEDVERVNAHVVARLREAGVVIAETYVCPHRYEDDCDCRKPKPRFLHRAAADYDVDLARSFSVGDHPCDFELARSVGGAGVYLLTGHGVKHRGEVPADCVVVEGIGKAATWIMASVPRE